GMRLAPPTMVRSRLRSGRTKTNVGSALRPSARQGHLVGTVSSLDPLNPNMAGLDAGRCIFPRGISIIVRLAILRRQLVH
ncbi:MAG TPA: hypothetical protein VGA01_18250, partial [Candidatus Binatia bacterium]